jgi:hypothetical protein
MTIEKMLADLHALAITTGKPVPKQKHNGSKKK